MIRLVFYVAFLLLIDGYFFQAVKRILKKQDKALRKFINVSYWAVTCYFILFALAFSAFPAMVPRAVMLYSISLFFILSLSKLTGLFFLLTDDILRFVKVAIRWLKILAGAIGGRTEISAPVSNSAISRSEFLSRVAVISAAVPFGSMVYGMFNGNRFNFQVRKVQLKIPMLPEGFKEMKIVQVSDIHIGSFFSDKPLMHAVKLISEQKPDVIFFTGDLVNNLASEAEDHIGILKEIKAPGGVFSILGNHDYGHYYQWKNEDERTANMERLKEIQKEAGWKLLLNENAMLEKKGEKIAIIGVENWSSKMDFPRYGKLSEAMKGTENVQVKFLLSHDPSHWEGEILGRHPDIAATFSGHTHGFQIGIETGNFKWSPVQYLYKQWAGLYTNNMQHLYVNRGLGFVGYMGRTGILPEITVFDVTTV